MAAKVGDQSLGEASKRFVRRARDRVVVADSLLILPAVAYSVVMLGYYALFGGLLQSLPSVFVLAAVPLVALLGSSRDVTRTWVPVATTILCYEALQGAVGSFAATRGLFSVYALDRALWGFNLTGWVQATFYSPAVTIFSTFFYSLHLPLIVIAAVALWRFRRDLFGRYVTAMVVTSYAALITFVLLPTAPPWYQGAAGDLFYGGTSSALPGGLLNLVAAFESDKFASFPSLHAAYAITFAYFMVRLDRRLAFIAIPVTSAILFSTLYLGQHYLIDLIAGAAYALIPCLLAERLWLGRNSVKTV